jgi:hypothetical protein
MEIMIKIMAYVIASFFIIGWGVQIYQHFFCGKKIKCNISSNGDKIYHLPGDRLYNVTKIDKTKGEFYAYTETEAMEKGFTRSKVR